MTSPPDFLRILDLYHHGHLQRAFELIVEYGPPRFIADLDNYRIPESEQEDLVKLYVLEVLEGK